MEQPKGLPPSEYFQVDFAQRPYTVAWEITRACALRCIHCRAEAQTKRHPLELSTEEGLRLIEQVAEMGKPILVITGGDPMLRRDLYDFVAYAKSQGLYVALSPSATKLVTRPALRRLKENGLDMVHVSLDGSTAEIHDAFRGFRGSFQRTMEIVADVLEEGIPLQIGTTVSRYNRHDLPAIAELVSHLGLNVWSVFFLVPIGRAQAGDMLSPQEHEGVYHWLCDLADRMPFRVRTTAAPAYRRVVIQRRQAAAGQAGDRRGSTAVWEQTGLGYAYRAGPVLMERGVNDGDGFCFVDHLGNVCPSGFLPLPAGNVRKASLGQIYRDAPLFRQLRDKTLLKGKCGRCPFRGTCGGSRARAFALTGDYLAEDPSCVYQPEPREE